MASTWVIDTPGGKVPLVDLPLGVFAEIEDRTGMQWGDIVTTPARTAKCAQAVYEACCRHVNATPVELTPAKIVDERRPVFSLQADDMPVAWNGETALPESEGAQVTTGSSGAPEPTGGRQQ